LPPVLFWQSEDGRFVALCLFFVSCSGLVASAFVRDVRRAESASPSSAFTRPAQVWRVRSARLGCFLLVQWAVFSVLCLAVNDAQELLAPALALQSLVPALCLAPYLTLVTRKPLAAVVFTVFLVGCMKLLGCIVVVLVYGWDASEHGHTQLPWTHPNLLVWFFWSSTALLCLVFYWLGERRFCRAYGDAG